MLVLEEKHHKILYSSNHGIEVYTTQIRQAQSEIEPMRGDLVTRRSEKRILMAMID